MDQGMMVDLEGLMGFYEVPYSKGQVACTQEWNEKKNLTKFKMHSWFYVFLSAKSEHSQKCVQVCVMIRNTALLHSTITSWNVQTVPMKEGDKVGIRDWDLLQTLLHPKQGLTSKGDPGPCFCTEI